MNDTPQSWRRDDFTVSTDRTRLPLHEAHALLQTTFWGPQTALPLFERAASNSICFGLYHHNTLIGFGRVVTDAATYAYWADIVTAEAFRGHGLGQWLCECMLEHPDLQGLRRIGLLTRDAASLYARIGFSDQLGTLIYMEKRSGSEGKAIQKD